MQWQNEKAMKLFDIMHLSNHIIEMNEEWKTTCIECNALKEKRLHHAYT